MRSLLARGFEQLEHADSIAKLLLLYQINRQFCHTFADPM